MVVTHIKNAHRCVLFSEKRCKGMHFFLNIPNFYAKNRILGRQKPLINT